MRILYIVTAFPRWPGDVITPWLTETIARLGDRGVEVEVLAPSYRGMDEASIDGVRVHRFRYAPRRLEKLTHDQTAPDRIRERPWYVGLVPGYLAGGSSKAIRLARSGRFHAIHCFWPVPHGVLALAARAASGVPVISTFFGVELTWVRRDLSFLSPVVRSIVRRSDAVTVISSHTAREVLSIAPGAEIRTIPFGAAVAGAERPSSSDRDTPTGAASVPSSGFRLLFVGRLVERKGVAVLLRAIARMRPAADVRLTVVGDGPLRAALESQARSLDLGSAVEFTGFVPEHELAMRFAASDAFVLPAVEDEKGDVEGLGVVLIESILHDRPVIASASGGIPDIVIDGVTGFLTRPGDEQSLVDAIEKLRTDLDLRSRLTAQAREHVARHFSWDRIVDQLTDLYAEVSGLHVPPRIPGFSAAAE